MCIRKEARTNPLHGWFSTIPQEDGKVEKGEDQVLDFVAQQAGTYEFKMRKGMRDAPWPDEGEIDRRSIAGSVCGWSCCMISGCEHHPK